MAQRLSVKRITDAFGRNRGMVAVAARNLGCSRQTIYAWMEAHPELKDVLADEREVMTDVAELSLYKQVQNGEGWAVKYYLSTQGKGRGYTETVNHRHGGDPDAPPIQTANKTEVTIVDADAYNREFAALLGLGGGPDDAGDDPPQ